MVQRSRNVAVVLAAAALVWAGCKKRNPDAALASALEKRCQEAVADGRVTEARAWLDPSQTSHVGFKVGTDEMTELTEAFYARGAVKVSAAWTVLGESQVSALLIVTLPAENRAPLFQKEKEIQERYDLDDVRDLGQSCLLIGLD
jgi:hypothetical protein